MDYLFVSSILKYADSFALFTGSAHKLPLSLEKKKISLKIKTSSCKEEPVCQIYARNKPLLLNFPVLHKYLWQGFGTFRLVKFKEAE